MNWINTLRYDPIKPLMNSQNKAIKYFVKVLLEHEVGPVSYIWKLPEVKNILKKQTENGSFKHSKRTEVYPEYHYSLVETWKNFRILVNRYRLTKDHPKGKKAAEFIFSCQTNEGDIRGMIGNQYATYYTGAMMALLIKAGYGNDPRIEKGFDWLINMRQNDGGWVVPIQTHNLSRDTQNKITSQYAKPLKPKRDMPSSRIATDMVLRAFAADPLNRYSDIAYKAGALLKSWFFKPDYYSSYRAAYYWVRFGFWWPNLKTALDSLSQFGFSKEDPDIKQALKWFIENQEPNGFWNLTYEKENKGFKDSEKNRMRRWWLTLEICRIFKKFFS